MPALPQNGYVLASLVRRGPGRPLSPVALLLEILVDNVDNLTKAALKREVCHAEAQGEGHLQSGLSSLMPDSELLTPLRYTSPLSKVPNSPPTAPIPLDKSYSDSMMLVKDKVS